MEYGNSEKLTDCYNTIMIRHLLIKTKRLSGGRKEWPPKGNGMKKTVLSVRPGDQDFLGHIGTAPALLRFFLKSCSKAGLGNGENPEGQKKYHNAVENQE